jgi:uncharacterized protein YndB with AHSA1/START domain
MSIVEAEAPVARTEMLIRRPVAQVFEAFVNPEITCKVWFSKGSARLQQGQKLRWDWEMYGASANVSVLAIEQDKRILIEWSGYESPTQVEWVFTPRADGSTFVSITNFGFTGDPAKVVQNAIESTEGFTFLLAGVKALLEHGVLLNCVPDRHPDRIIPDWDSNRPR